MARATRPVPEGYHTITPHLVVRDAGAAIELHKRTFGATERSRSLGPDGNWGTKSLQALGGSPVTIHLYVEDVDAAFERVTKAGAQVMMPLADQFWGDRCGAVIDPFGHHWSIATHVEDLSPEELAQRQAAAFKA